MLKTKFEPPNQKTWLERYKSTHTQNCTMHFCIIVVIYPVAEQAADSPAVNTQKGRNCVHNIRRNAPRLSVLLWLL